MEANKRSSRAFIGLVAALPLLALQLIYLSDIHGWNVALSYGLIFFAIVVVGVCWVVYAVVEYRKRRGQSTDLFRTPWFSLAGLVFLVTFFPAGEWARPVVEKIPGWCRVRQVVKWETSKLDERYGGGHRYVLVLTGRGNIEHHDFTSGYLNWTGDQSAGFSGVDLDDLTFSKWVGYDHVTVPATFDAVCERVRSSTLPEEEVMRISGEIWKVMEQARNDSPISVSSGIVDPVWDAPYDDENVLLGASIWSTLLLGVFQVIAWRSLPATKSLVDSE